MRINRAQHIIVKRLDDPDDVGPIYVQTLCRRIIHTVFLSGNDLAKRHGYIAWDQGVDCQDCLRKHFKKAMR